MIADERKKRLTDAMKDAGLDALLVYGNAWQGDYLRYATDFGILEGQALAIVRSDGHITLYVDSALEADRAALDCPGVECVLAIDLVGEVDQAMNRMRNQRIGAAPQRLLPRRIAARAEDLKLSDETGFVDRLLMGKLDSEIAAIRKSAKLADAGYKVFMQAARVGRADYELIAESEAFFRANGVDDNFQIIGVGGVEVKGMAPPSGKRLEARRHGDDGAHALRRRLLRADLPDAGGRRADARAEGRACAVARVDGGRHRHRARRRHRRRHRQGRERRVPQIRHGQIHHQRVHPRARPRHGPVRRYQAAHSRRRHHADRRRHGADRASQHLSSGRSATWCWATASR